MGSRGKTREELGRQPVRARDRVISPDNADG
jgi:hypothetical protein